MQNFLTKASFWLIVACSTACVSTPKSGKTASDVTPVAAQITGASIVMQAMSKDPILSDQSKSHWISLKNSNGESLDRMRGQLATGDWERAIESAKNFLKKHPNHPEALMGIAAANAIGRKFEMASYYAMLVLKIQPGNADAMNIMGLRIMMSTGNRRADYQDALTWFQRSLDSDSTQIAAGLNMGHLQLDLGASAEAIAPFRTASERCKTCRGALMGLAIASSRSGRGDDALVALKDVLNQDSSNAEARFQMAIVYKNNFQDIAKSQAILQEIVSDADGRYKNGMQTKRQANVVLRKLKSTDRTGDELQYATQNVRPTGKGKGREVIPTERTSEPKGVEPSDVKAVKEDGSNDIETFE
ncbi:MAG: tetratricopeptide repeat protein [Proteobacteria bacterium]|nr:tetratricopeptide repeat protein [Pseudomonadota bacterium]